MIDNVERINPGINVWTEETEMGDSIVIIQQAEKKISLTPLLAIRFLGLLAEEAHEAILHNLKQGFHDEPRDSPEFLTFNNGDGEKKT